MMDHSLHHPIPFQSGWLSFELPGYRYSSSTYTVYSYDDLPLLPQRQLRGMLYWLVPLDPELDAHMQPYRPTTVLGKEWETFVVEAEKELITSARQAEITLPDVFLTFMASTRLQDRIPSVTDCWFRLTAPVPCPVTRNGFIIRFLQDQQSCVIWYLYLSPGGETCVLASHVPLDGIVLDPETYGHISEEEIMRHTYVCAPSFEAFLYRFWMENVLWWKLHYHKPLTPAQHRYLAYYIQKEAI